MNQNDILIHKFKITIEVPSSKLQAPRGAEVNHKLQAPKNKSQAPTALAIASTLLSASQRS